ncbi:hypothetical protein TEA_007966 [Camellia sinensis var. sinensis]|uniref:Glycosyltransferase n=1 Tax=Camellia sinensis var. sinensis TaxID=542762 RepID=A0A4S4EV95_CAMSN|nr:hypothetical protein TEA_007966 [Camellia sinensis var. sinensis]
MSKAQLVFIPSPGIGHLVSTVEMAKLLVGRDDRLSITILIMKFPFDNKGTTTQSLSSDRIRFLDLFHDASSTADPNSKAPDPLLYDYIENHKTPVRDVVSEIVSKSESESETESTPRLAGFVIDMLCTPMIDVANEFGVPTYVFFTSSAGFLSLMFHIDTLQQDITELKGSDAELNVPAYANPVPAKVLPSVLFDKEGGFTMFINITKRCRETEGIIVNTFTELEFRALKSLQDDHTIPKVYSVGPVLNLKGGSSNEAQNSQSEADIMRWLDDQDPSSVVFLCFGSMGSFDGDQVKEIARALESCGHRDDHTIPKIYPVGPVLNLKGGSPNEAQNSQSEVDIMRWLDDQDPSSVVFLCFGSMGSFDGDQVKEIARALESSGHRFLWSLRQPPPKGKIELPKQYENPTDVLPEGFLDRMAEIGKVIGWAPQVAVLSHRAVGGFVSHCGWNSTLESLWCGVPVATWPMYAEQQMNAFQLVREFGMAVEIKMDYRKDFGMKEMPVMVTAEEISSGIRQLMDVSDEIKHKVKKMSEESRVAVTEGGSSYCSLGCFIEDVIQGRV